MTTVKYYSLGPHIDCRRCYVSYTRKTPSANCYVCFGTSVAYTQNKKGSSKRFQKVFYLVPSSKPFRVFPQNPNRKVLQKTFRGSTEKPSST